MFSRLTRRSPSKRRSKPGRTFLSRKSLAQCLAWFTTEYLSKGKYYHPLWKIPLIFCNCFTHNGDSISRSTPRPRFSAGSYDFGDGSDHTKPMPSEEVSTVSYQYSMPGNYTVTAVFTDVPGVSEVGTSRGLKFGTEYLTGKL